jgi:hypothetical protein
VEFLPQGSTINARVYCDKLKKLRRAIQKKRCGMLSSVVMLLDNARPHTPAAAPPPYSPNVVPGDFHVLLHLKTFLGGRQFHDDNEVKEVINTWFCITVPQQWRKLCRKVV